MKMTVLSNAVRKVMLHFGWVPLADLEAMTELKRWAVRQVGEALDQRDAALLAASQAHADARLLSMPREDGGRLIQAIVRY